FAGIPEEAIGDFAKVYRGYLDYCRHHNLMDFDDQLLLTLRLFKTAPDVAAAIQDRYRHVMVAEFQDTNPVQWMITRAISHPHNNLFVVGDDAQAIYQFRGADIRGILTFTRDYPKARRIPLAINYRSLSPII